jgi:ketosteroid isomerase-like protein
VDTAHLSGKTGGGQNLAAVIGAFVEAYTAGSLEAMRVLLAEDVVWDGPMPGTRCGDRGDVMAMLGRRFGPGRAMPVTWMEAVEDGDRVVIAASGPDFHPDGVAGPPGEVFLVFTLRDGRIVHMRGTQTREEAFAARD